MKNIYYKINVKVNKLVDDILYIEEQTLKLSPFDDVTTTELHVINAIGISGEKTMSELAKNLHITVGTLTTSINNLVKKDLARRNKDEKDRRLVYIGLTRKGKVLYRLHEKFHLSMIKEVVGVLEPEEEVTFFNLLEKLQAGLTDFERGLTK